MKATVKTWTPTKYPRLYRHSSGTYYARISTAGKETWRSLKTKVLSVAKIEHEKEQASAEQRAELGAENLLSEKLTGAAAFAIRQRQFQNNPAIKQSTKHYLEQIVLMVKRTWPELEETALRRVTVEQCEEWAGRVAKQMSSPRFNASLSMVRSLFEIAVERGVRRTNPAAKIKRKRVKVKDLSSMLPSRAQFAAWVNTIRGAGGRFSRDCADYVEFLAYTGVRVGEAAWVQWRHCDFQRGEILITGNPNDGTKNHEMRRIPMVPAARILLERLQKENPDAQPTDRVLGVTMAKKAMDRAFIEAKIPRITHHDLRHYFATICIESGVDIPTVSKWLGHKDGGALAMKVYGHLRNEHSLAAATRVSFAA
ncbi:MAG: site-specific integrase [Verrucomicrobiaceae bacterium]|nr:site-specific integrase [Verrucomicrobiaceae bacterium]